ncbi:PIN domain-containing protein [Saccharothrix australiensis]|uniref:VapC50 C-terminal domain-containing protein n=1 Tax=Saccharothrix australiensis TaxID=2072 RepID=A0A495VTE2_9PSEU|nr:PIN domain-containing protein [Saccharothrix australiensis]RKT51685.1 hypothetical protein C8E97_0166 [Saccharothrix australiensis]
MFPAFFDTCVLFKPYLRDTVLSIAETGLYRPLWSTSVLEELERNLRRRGVDEHRISRLRGQLRSVFPEAEVTGYTDLVDQLDLAPRTVHRALRTQVSRYRRSPRSVAELLDVLANDGHACKGFADACRRDITWRSSARPVRGHHSS